MDTKVLGKALSIIVGIVAVFGVNKYSYASSTLNDCGICMSKSDVFGNDLWPSEWEQMASNGLNTLLIGLGIFAFGLLLIYLTKSKEETKEQQLWIMIGLR